MVKLVDRVRTCLAWSQMTHTKTRRSSLRITFKFQNLNFQPRSKRSCCLPIPGLVHCCLITPPLQACLIFCGAGSCFVLQLLSASHTASYYYEPLYCLRPNATIVERAVQGNTFNRELVGEMVRRIFECDTQILSELDKYVVDTDHHISHTDICPGHISLWYRRMVRSVEGQAQE